MRIIIVGGGKTAEILIQHLEKSNHDIIIIDKLKEVVESITNRYSVNGVCGSGASRAVLASAGADTADALISLTPIDEINLLACSMAKSLGAKKTVARIDNDEFLKKEHKDYFTALGVDNLIYPEYLASKEIITALKRTWVRNWFELFDGELIVVGVKLRNNAKLVGHRLKDLSEVSSFLHVSAIKRNRETIIPRGDDVIMENDIAYIATTHDHIDEVVDICGKEKIDVGKVLIMGGNPIAVQLAQMVQNRYRVKIIDKILILL